MLDVKMTDMQLQDIKQHDMKLAHRSGKREAE